jgi:hypothetical protein
MGGVSTNQRIPEKTHLHKHIKTGLKWLDIAALIAAGLFVVLFIVEIVVFALYKPVPTTYSIASATWMGMATWMYFMPTARASPSRTLC